MDLQVIKVESALSHTPILYLNATSAFDRKLKYNDVAEVCFDDGTAIPVRIRFAKSLQRGKCTLAHNYNMKLGTGITHIQPISYSMADSIEYFVVDKEGEHKILPTWHSPDTWKTLFLHETLIFDKLYRLDSMGLSTCILFRCGDRQRKFALVGKKTRFIPPHCLHGSPFFSEEFFSSWKRIALPSIILYEQVINDFMNELKGVLSCEKTSKIQFSLRFLFEGAAGSGKSVFLHKLAVSSGLAFIEIDSSTFSSQNDVNRVKSMLLHYENPLILIDNIDYILDGKCGFSKEERLKLSLFEKFLNEISPSCIVLASCTTVNDQIISWFDFGYKFESLKEAELETLLFKLLEKWNIAEKDDLIKHIVKETLGFSISDYCELLRNCAISLCKQYGSSAIENNSISKDAFITNFTQEALKITPSGLKEYFFKTPNASFDDLVGLKEPKSTLKSIIENKLNVLPKGILIYGEPGTGKSHLAYAFIKESRLSCISLDSAAIRSKFVGDAEATITKVFVNARSSSPCIILLDNIDSLLSSVDCNSSSAGHSRILSCFFSEMDSSRNVLLLGLTSNLDAIDSSFLRPGRFDCLLETKKINEIERLELIEKLRSENSLLLSQDEIDELLKLTENYSANELRNLYREAALLSLRRDFNSAHVHNQLIFR